MRIVANANTALASDVSWSFASRLATIPIQMTTSERFDGLNDKCRHRYLLKIIIHLPIDLNDLIQQENFCLTTVVS